MTQVNNEDLVQIVESHKQSISFFKEVFSALDATIQSLHEVVQQLDSRIQNCENTLEKAPQTYFTAPPATERWKDFGEIESKLTDVSKRLHTLESVLKSSKRSLR